MREKERCQMKKFIAAMNKLINEKKKRQLLRKLLLG